MVDGNAVDVLHSDVELAVFGGAAIEQVGDGGMTEAGQDLSFAPKTLAERLQFEGQPDDFQGHLLIEFASGAVRQVDRAHTAAANQAIEQIRADAMG